MLGINAFPQRDCGHPFDMGPYADLPTIIQGEVRPGEMDHSTLFFETARAARNIQLAHGLAEEEVQLVFGRGTPTHRTERQLEQTLLSLNTGQADRPLVVVVAKSLGALDALETLEHIDQDVAKRAAVGPVHMLVLLDPAGPKAARSRRCTTHPLGEDCEDRLRIPSIVGQTWNVVQREGVPLLQGQLAGAPGQADVVNRVLEPEDVDGQYRYCGYADGTARELRTCHFHMEEIVSVMPCLATSDGPLTLGPLIERGWRNRDELAAMVTTHGTEQRQRRVAAQAEW